MGLKPICAHTSHKPYIVAYMLHLYIVMVYTETVIAVDIECSGQYHVNTFSGCYKSAFCAFESSKHHGIVKASKLTKYQVINLFM